MVPVAKTCVRTGKVETWLTPLSSPVLQAREFAESGDRTTRSGYEVAPISAAALAALAPGMCPNALAAAAQGDGRGAALLVQGGLVLHPERYVRCDPRFIKLVSWTQSSRDAYHQACV